MIRGLELDRGPDTDCPLMNPRLEEGRIGISGNLRAKPAEIRPQAGSVRVVPVSRDLGIAVLAYRTPDSPRERAVGPLDRDVETRPDVVALALLAVDLALLLAQSDDRDRSSSESKPH